VLNSRRGDDSDGALSGFRAERAPNSREGLPPPRISRLGKVRHDGGYWSPPAAEAEDIVEQLRFLPGPNQVGSKLLCRVSLAVVADIDHDELRVLDA
jgi:hypothetical protein